jgi:hypothetical protein
MDGFRYAQHEWEETVRFQAIIRIALSGAAIVAISGGSAAAQEQSHQIPGAAGSVDVEQAARCSQNSQAVTQTLEAANLRIEEARQANNAAAMRAAIGDLQMAIARMKTQLADCVSLTTPMAGMDHSKMPGMATSKSQAAPASAGVSIIFQSRPSPAHAGNNTFEATIRDRSGTPIADADVSVAFSMPAMPSMKTPEVRLAPIGGGVYRGVGSLGMVGDWDVTITATRQGQALGLEKMRLAVQ